MSEQRLIRPQGMKMGDELDLLYMWVKAFQTLCKQLDADGGVTATNYEALCYTAIMNTIINDTRGNQIGQKLSTGDKHFHIIGPSSITTAARLSIIYQMFDMWETLLEKLDAGAGVTDTDYESLHYTAAFLWRVMNDDGLILGNDNFLFKPGGAEILKELIDLYYAMISSFHDVCEKLDDDGGVTDTTYEALCYTAILKVQVMNSKGNIIGN